MARRLIIWSTGMQISKPGIDATNPGQDSDLLFSTNRRHFMMLDSGFVVLPTGGAGIRVPFARPAPSVPLAVVMSAGGEYVVYPTIWGIDTTGITMAAAGVPNGTFPAGGTGVRWFAFMRTRQ
jgi:hypothetical protein